MLIRSVPLLLVAANSAYAIKDALPFFLLSTESISPAVLSSQQLFTASSLESNLRKALGSCDASQYIFVEYPGLRTSDISESSSMPHFAQRLSNEAYKSVVQIPEVMGKLPWVDIQIEVEEKCGRQKVTQTVLQLLQDKGLFTKMPKIGTPQAKEARGMALHTIDAKLDQYLHSIVSNHTSHVIIFSATPVDEDAIDLERLRYEMDEPPFQEQMHTDLKRDVPEEIRRQASGGNDFQDGLPLFEKYQFLSPGIFMGLFVSIMLLVILYVGISAIAGLEVSYMAFSKEMGPSAQKKQQ